MSELPVGWEDAALEAANLDMSNDESPRFFAKIIAIRTANRLAALQAKRIAELKAQRNELSVIREHARVAIEQLEAERDALKVQLGCIMKWATTDEDEPQTGFDEGYEAARRWVLEVGLCATLAERAKP